MNNSLIFLVKKSFINFFKKSLKKSLKAFGMILLVAYYIFIPFIMKGFISDIGLNTASGFVLIASLGTLYLTMPVTLSYFKRKGVNFKKQDINFILASPTSPKNALIYALSKEVYINLAMQVMFFIAAVFVFEISLLTSLLYILVNVVVSNLLSYSLAIIMYASEDITLKQKQGIKRIIYVILAGFTVFLLTSVISQTMASGFDLSYVTSVVTSPAVLLIPIFGWQLGWLNLIMLGLTPVRLITTVLFFASAIGLTYYAYKMRVSGEYYEDALSFSENIALLESKKGDISLSEAFGKKKKNYDYKGELKGFKSHVIFHKQLIERRRSKKYFLSFGDLFYLVAGIGIGLSPIFINDFINPDYYFEIMIGISLYLSIFFKPGSAWKSEFKNHYLFLMPDSPLNKLFNASLLEHLMSTIRAVFLAVPAGLLMGASFLEIFYAVSLQILLKVMMTYVSILIEAIIGARIGKTLAGFINILVSIIIMIVPFFALIFIGSISLFYSFLAISLYAVIVTLLFLYLCSINLRNIESLEE
ncbi:MAG: putative ABC exporter domain-containing protein [Alkalibacterium sp.]|uniref:Putative ABC exporter n=1 Tax=Alkalibacterium gilvum TaxID=1130080 RepID=A0A1H6S2T9_9LACT|nr:putative ABC exporter domain-containing protein [Alkalibacterium gilvum]MDN6294439.1 putative ABC exporter domain-containing protein [Alkalibacterium sp.]SEI62261.1 Putative ABC exporter [Alkalibacterium gilvum]